MRFERMVKFVTTTFWLGKPFCPLPFLSDCWVTISVVMEWNGNGYGTHGYGGRLTDWALGSGLWRLSMMTMTMTMLFHPPTPPPYTLVRSSRAYTRPLPRVTRVPSPSRGGGGGGGGGWMTRWCWQSVDAAASTMLPRTWTHTHTDGDYLHVDRYGASSTLGFTRILLLPAPRYRIGPTRTGVLWIGSNTWHAPIPIPPAQIEPTTALRRGRRWRPPCIPIRRHPGESMFVTKSIHFCSN